MEEGKKNEWNPMESNKINNDIIKDSINKHVTEKFRLHLGRLHLEAVLGW